MTKKDFNLIADTINRLPLPRDQKALVAERFANRLILTNPRFQHSRFIEACMKGGDPV